MNRRCRGVSLLEFTVGLGVMAVVVVAMGSIITWFNQESRRAIGRVNFNSDMSDFRISLERRYSGRRVDVGLPTERDLPYDFRDAATRANAICGVAFQGAATALGSEVTISNESGQPMFRAGMKREGYLVSSARVQAVSQSAADPTMRLVTFRVTADFNSGPPTYQEILILAKVSPVTGAVAGCETVEEFERGRIYGNCYYAMDAGFVPRVIFAAVSPYVVCPAIGATGTGAWSSCAFPGFKPVVNSMVQMSGQAFGQLMGMQDIYIQSWGCLYDP